MLASKQIIKYRWLTIHLVFKFSNPGYLSAKENVTRTEIKTKIDFMADIAMVCDELTDLMYVKGSQSIQGTQKLALICNDNVIFAPIFCIIYSTISEIQI